MKLKPCPFCGGKALPIERSVSIWDLKPHDFTVICRNCRAGIRQYFETAEEAAATWNRRVGDDLMERMEDDCK